MIKEGRRLFIKRAGTIAAAFTIVPRHVPGGRGYTPPGNQLTKAIIGAGGMGRGHFNYEGTRLIAVCDVDKSHLKQAVNLAKENIKAFHDFRELLAQPDIDIVHIATPPHWHGIMAKMAAEAGKDIWCEKSITGTLGSLPFASEET